jgi:ElaB/YqjD/DUF883 family membrane-anchored ribosome-binding protein
MAQINYSSDPAGTAHDLREKAGDQLGKVADHVENAARAVADQGREVAENVHKVAESFKTAVDTSVKEQPMATLAIAAILGFVLGAVWKL